MRTVELLPLVPTTWIARSAPAGCRARSSSRRMRSSPKRMPNSSSERRCSSARSRLQVTVSASSSRSRSSLSRSACTTAAGALATKRSLPSLPSARAISASSSRAAGRGAARLRLEVDGVGGEHRDRAAGDGDRGHRLAAVAAPLQAGEPGDVLGGGLVAGRVEARGDGLAGRGADAVAPAAQLLHRLDHARQLLLGGRVAQRVVGLGVAAGHQQAVGAGHVGPDLLRDERDQRVRERERLAQHVQRELAASPALSSS